jgi:TM2 domain-containing membrane protein YozV
MEKRINKHVYTWVGSFLFGWLGVDRFMRGQILFGILKLLSYVLCVLLPIGRIGLLLGSVWIWVDFIIALTKLGKFEKEFVFVDGKWNDGSIKIKPKKDFEEFKNTKVYEVAVKIKEELEKKGYENFGEPEIKKHDAICGEFRNRSVIILFSEYQYGLNISRLTFRNLKITEKQFGKRYYGIENENKTFLVYSSEDDKNVSQNIPESIKIAAEVIKNNGYGECTEIRV